MALYRGFSTVNRPKRFKVSDFELAKQDLYNHLHIRKGEKLMNPDFGTIIWGLLFEPLTETLKSAIQEDLKTIVSYDPRLQVNNLIISEFQQGIQVQIDLTFLTTDERSTMNLQFDRESSTTV